MLNRILLIGLLLSLFGCNKEEFKPVLEVDTNYIGTWRGSYALFYVFIQINSDGSGLYERSISGPGSEGWEQWNGDVVVSDAHIKFDGSPKFTIVEPPTLIDTLGLPYDTITWEMKLSYPKTIGYDGAEFTVYR